VSPKRHILFVLCFPTHHAFSAQNLLVALEKQHFKIVIKKKNRY
jgi:hypothetical protein